MPRNEYICDCEAVNAALVSEVSAKLPRNDELFSLSAFYKILGDHTRCKILFALQENEMCVCDLAALLSMTKSAVSHQLALMRSAAVVKCRRAGKEVYYSLDDGHVSEVFSVGLSHIQHKLKVQEERI